ncbi:hypothetical protein DES53_104230 [Roseimicrobium gellanilyticum]|uniref:Uncharacterized protein n=1 Tax=Roseimicrobium gellanilyticum TaxID=748857 RepID=A0A366HPM3_9BACT|nr:hypothetical protein DES53_104230 [Roseimicrobium gellanilyticum]
MDTHKSSELGNAKWRVQFLQRVLHVHRCTTGFHGEAWTVHEKHFLQQIAAAEECLHELEASCAEVVEAPVDIPRPYRASGTPGDGPGLISRGVYAQYPAPFRTANVFSSGSLSE